MVNKQNNKLLKFVLSKEKTKWKVLQPEIIEIVLLLLPNILSLNLLRKETGKKFWQSIIKQQLTGHQQDC
jgi:hypothetical protein